MLIEIGRKLIEILLESGPYILLGFTIAGILHVLFPVHLFSRMFGKQGLMPLLRAIGLGALIPVCSCGVVPIGMGAYRSGAGLGTALAFMTAAPTLSPSSVLLSYNLLGFEITFWQGLFVIVGSCLLGIIANRFYQPRSPITSAPPAELIQLQLSPALHTDCCSGPERSETPFAGVAVADCCQSTTVDYRPVSVARPGLRPLGQMLKWIFYDFGPGICFDMLLGLIFAAIVLTIVPASQIAAFTGTGSLASLLFVVLLALPIYTCSMAAIPVVFGFLAAGMSPGAAVAFIIAGPATNFGEMNAIRGQAGWRAAVYYFFSLLAVAISAGWLIDHWIQPQLPNFAALPAHQHHHTESWALLPWLSLLLLGGMMLTEAIKRLKRILRRCSFFKKTGHTSTSTTSSHMQETSAAG